MGSKTVLFFENSDWLTDWQQFALNYQKYAKHSAAVWIYVERTNASKMTIQKLSTVKWGNIARSCHGDEIWVVDNILKRMVVKKEILLL